MESAALVFAWVTFAIYAQGLFSALSASALLDEEAHAVLGALDATGRLFDLLLPAGTTFEWVVASVGEKNIAIKFRAGDGKGWERPSRELRREIRDEEILASARVIERRRAREAKKHAQGSLL